MRLSPEQALLVKAAAAPGRHDDPGSTDQAAVQWDRLIDMAEWHRLSPLLWWYLHAHGRDALVPHGAFEQLHRAAADTTARNLVLRDELNRVIEVLTGARIPAMLLKGAALIETVYPDIGLRPMGDLDILVPRSSIEDAHRAVETLGYAVWGVRLGRHDAAQLARHHHHYPLERGSVTVELHHHVVSGRADFDIAGFWERAVAGTGTAPHVVPAPEDLFLHGALHFSADRIARLPAGLGQLADLSRITAHWAIDWDALTRRAGGYKVADQLFLALVAGEVLLGGLAPPDAVEALRPESYRPALGEQFVRQCVLRSAPGVPLDRLAFARGSAFPGRLGLDRYIGDETSPSVTRLRARRAMASGRRLAVSVASPRGFLTEVRLGWWIRSLRR